jgi:hypothetical protein
VGYLNDEPVVMGGWRFTRPRSSDRGAQQRSSGCSSGGCRGLGSPDGCSRAGGGRGRCRCGLDGSETGGPQVAAVALYRSSGSPTSNASATTRTSPTRSTSAGS